MAFGFRPSRYIAGGPWNGSLMRCVGVAGYGSAIYPGDLVALVTGGGDEAGGADPNTGAILPTVELAAAGARILGAVVGIEPDRGDLSSRYRAASTERQLMVAVAQPGLVFEAQADAAIALTSIGNNFDHNAGAGTAALARSGHDIDVATAATTTAGVTLVGVRNDPANLATITSGSGTTSTIWEVVIAEPQVAINQLGAGV